MGDMYDRMRAGESYRDDGDERITAAMKRANALMHELNRADLTDRAGLRAILERLLGAFGADSTIRPPFHCDFGRHTFVGERVFVNVGLVALDVADIVIGDDTQIGPGVQLLTPTHPLQPGPRRAKWEAAEPITIGENVWIGGGAIVCPGRTIGDDSVIGAGAVVTRDVPAGVLAVGNPARVVRSLAD